MPVAPELYVPSSPSFAHAAHGGYPSPEGLYVPPPGGHPPQAVLASEAYRQAMQMHAMQVQAMQAQAMQAQADYARAQAMQMQQLHAQAMQAEAWALRPGLTARL